MSKYIKVEDAINRLMALCDDLDYVDVGNRVVARLKIYKCVDLLSDLPTIEVSEDCISKAAAIDIIKNYDFEFPEYMERFVNELRDAMKKDLVEDIKDAPSVVPTVRKNRTVEQSSMVGEWKHYMGDLWTCTACGESLMCDDIECNNYCPNCGAKMRLE